MKRITILLLLCSLLMVSCFKDEQQIWDPPMDGIKMGMTLEEVKTVLISSDVEFTETYIEDSQQTRIVITEPFMTNYDIAMSVDLCIDDDLQLFSFTGYCDKEDVDDLKEKMEERYAYEERETKEYLDGKYVEEYFRWSIGKVSDLMELDQIMSWLDESMKEPYEKFSYEEDYETWVEGIKKSFQDKDLISVRLSEPSDGVGILIINSWVQLQVDKILSE